MTEEEAAGSPTTETSMETREEGREEQETDRGHRLVLPDDGHIWKKYGQKFIRNIGKFRSYFRCQRQNCSAKKRVEWSKPDNLRIIYEGGHNHAEGSSSSSSQGRGTSSSSTSAANQYDLYTQVFGDQTAPAGSGSMHQA